MMIEMYKNLFIVRREHRMTQEDAGKLVNICQQTYYLKEKENVILLLQKQNYSHNILRQQ